MIDQLLFATLMVVITVLIHGAGLYLLPGAVADLETPVYFSTITYAGIGFDDADISHRWRLVSAIEGVNGILLLGWSTTFFVTVVAWLRR